MRAEAPEPILHSSTKGNFSFLKAIVEKITHDGCAFRWLFVKFQFLAFILSITRINLSIRWNLINLFHKRKPVQNPSLFCRRSSSGTTLSSLQAKYVQLLFIIYCYIFIILNLRTNLFFSPFHIALHCVLASPAIEKKNRKNRFHCCLITIFTEARLNEPREEKSFLTTQ